MLSAKKANDFALWYTQVVVEAELISYYSVSGEWIVDVTDSDAAD